MFCTVGEVSLLRLSPSESRFTRLRLVALLMGPPGPGFSLLLPPLNGHPCFSTGLRPFQKTAVRWDAEKEKGHPRPSTESAPSPPVSPPGLSSPQSEPTELLNDSEEILREDMVVVVMMLVVMVMIM